MPSKDGREIDKTGIVDGVAMFVKSEEVDEHPL